MESGTEKLDKGTRGSAIFEALPEDLEVAERAHGVPADRFAPQEASLGEGHPARLPQDQVLLDRELADRLVARVGRRDEAESGLDAVVHGFHI